MEKKCTQWPPKITLNTYLVEFSEKFAIFSYFSVSCDPLDGGSVCRGSLSCNMFLGLPNNISSSSSNLVASNACKIVA